MRRSLTLLTAAVAITAADPTELGDFRVGLGVAPMPTRKDGLVTRDSSGAATGASVNESFAMTPGLGFGIKAAYGTLAPVGLVYGGELRYVNGRQRLIRWAVAGQPMALNQSESYSYSSLGLAVNLGLGVACAPAWHVEVVAIAGLDQISSNSPANPESGGGGSLEGKGNGRTSGIRAATYWTDLASSWQAGLELEWTRTISDLESSYIRETVRFEHVTAEGVGFRAVVGHRF